MRHLAVYVKTESGDDYIWCIFEDNDVIQFVKDCLGEESKHICEMKVTDNQDEDHHYDISEFWEEE